MVPLNIEYLILQVHTPSLDMRTIPETYSRKKNGNHYHILYNTNKPNKAALSLPAVSYMGTSGQHGSIRSGTDRAAQPISGRMMI